MTGCRSARVKGWKHQPHELGPEWRRVAEPPAHDRSGGDGWGLHPAHLHAEVAAAGDHRHIRGPGSARHLIRDLRDQALLQLESAGGVVCDASELGQPEHEAVGEVADGDVGVEGQEVVFAERPHAHGPDGDEVVAGLLLEHGRRGHGVVEELAPEAGDASRGVAQAFAPRVFPDGVEQGVDELFDHSLVNGHAGSPKARCGGGRRGATRA